MLKVQSAMAVLIGIQEVAKTLNKDSAARIMFEVLAHKAKVAILGTETVATEGATIAQRALNVAMSLNPITAIIVGLTALVAALELFSDNTYEATDYQYDFMDALEKQGITNKNYIDQLADINGELLITQARLRGASEQEIKGLEASEVARKARKAGAEEYAKNVVALEAQLQAVNEEIAKNERIGITAGNNYNQLITQRKKIAVTHNVYYATPTNTLMRIS